jgi:Ca2+/H+ antiporter
MLLKQKINPEKRMQLLMALGPVAGLALVLSIFLGRTGNPALDFGQGFLVGISIVGNLVYVFVITRHMREKRGQS